MRDGKPASRRRVGTDCHEAPAVRICRNLVSRQSADCRGRTDQARDARGDRRNGVSSVLDPKEWSLINGDVALNLARLPVGEWILVNAETSLGRDGVGVSSARLADGTGYFGRAAQSLIVERR